MVKAVATGLALAALAAAAAFAAEQIPDGRMPAPATPTEALYRAVAVVTGTRIQTRLPGFAECLGAVLVKVTGDHTILADTRLAGAAKDAQDYVVRFSYHDRFAGKREHDEQGTHDRPHNLTVDFDRAKVNALVRKLDRKPWPAPRPRVAALVAVENVKASFVLARDGTIDRSADMREAFAAAAGKAALPPVALPSEAELAARGWTYKTLPAAKLAEAQALARADGANAAVVGHMVFSEKALGWIADWRMAYGGKTYRWGTRGVNFDAAFRNALFGAAHVMAGLGPPDTR